MYQVLIVCHTWVRWLVSAGLLFSLFRAYYGLTKNTAYSPVDDLFRHWSATAAHIQLVLGILLYTQSPVVKYFWNNFSDAVHNLDALFFGLIHIILMLTSIVMITVGSSLAKRKQTDKEKFRTWVRWYLIALILIVIAIPWPFSPLANRPYFR